MLLFSITNSDQRAERPQTTAPSPYEWIAKRQQAEPRYGKLYSVQEAKKLLGTCATTIRRWSKRGLLKTVRQGEKGWHKVPQAELERLLDREILRERK